MTSGQPQFESRTGNERLIDDDNFHVPETDAWLEHETVWFWWFHPERKLGCWIYHYLRPNIGVAGGGVFVFDDTAWFHMETPYSLSYSNTALPPLRDLRDFTFPGGSRIEMLQPLRRYRLTYSDPTGHRLLRRGPRRLSDLGRSTGGTGGRAEAPRARS